MAMFGYRPPVAKAKPNPFAARPLFATAPDSIAPPMGEVAGMAETPNLRPSFFQSGGTGNKILDALGRFAIAADANNGGQGSMLYLQNQQRQKMMEQERYAPQHVGNNIVRLDRETGQYVTDYQGKPEGGSTAQEIADLRAAGATDSDIQNLIRRKTELPPQTITTTDPTTGEMRMFTVPRGGATMPQAGQGAMPTRPMVGDGTYTPQSVGGMFPGARMTSGYRTPERNRAVGGVPNSMHTRGAGQAVDLVPGKGQTIAQMADAARRRGGFSEIVPEGDHLHLGWGQKGGSKPVSSGPAPGTMMGGYRFIGGNPNDRLNWQKVG